MKSGGKNKCKGARDRNKLTEEVRRPLGMRSREQGMVGLIITKKRGKKRGKRETPKSTSKGLGRKGGRKEGVLLNLKRQLPRGSRAIKGTRNETNPGRRR